MPFNEGNFGENKEQSGPNKAYYDILGVAEGASPDEIKKAYQREAQKCHPDKLVFIIKEREKAGQKVDRKKLEEELTAKFKNLENAYSILSNSAKNKRTNGESQQAEQDRMTREEADRKKEQARKTAREEAERKAQKQRKEYEAEQEREVRRKMWEQAQEEQRKKEAEQKRQEEQAKTENADEEIERIRKKISDLKDKIGEKKKAGQDSSAEKDELEKSKKEMDEKKNRKRTAKSEDKTKKAEGKGKAREQGGAGTDQREQKQDNGGQEKEKEKEADENSGIIEKIEQRGGRLMGGGISVGVRIDGKKVLVNSRDKGKAVAISEPFNEIIFTDDELILGQRGNLFNLIDPATDKAVTEILRKAAGFGTITTREIKENIEGFKGKIKGVKDKIIKNLYIVRENTDAAGNTVETKIIKFSDYKKAVQKLKDSYLKVK